jgi:ribonucleotide reductase alpha subunit
LGMWNNQTIDQIIKNRGSIQNLKLPSNGKDIKKIYKTVWELSQKILIDQAYDRSPYIDQTQSLNLYLENPTFAALASMDMYAYEKQLKTICYYTRSKSSMDAIMFTIMEDTVGKMIKMNKNEENKNNEDKENNENICYKGCVSCSG